MIIFIDESGIHKCDGRSSVVLIYIALGDSTNVDKAVIAAEKELK